MEDQLPKVLVVSINAWRDNTGINTLIDMFRAWQPERLAQIYTRSTLPLTTVCSRFFQISESKMMKSIIKRRLKTGQEVNNGENAAVMCDTAQEEENRYKNSGHSDWLKIAREFVWLLGRWKTKELDAFIESVSPDLLFMPIYPNIYMGWLQLYALKKTGKPVVCYLADDNYTYRAIKGNLLMTMHRFFLRRVIKKVVGQCSQMFVIAPKQKEEYDQIFGVNSVIITKGIDYEHEYESFQPHQPLRMVYTGKLIIGRWMSLVIIADALGEINRDGTRITFDIYTTDQLTEEQNQKLNRNGCVVRGAVSLDEAKRVQQEVDIVVFVESLDRKFRDAARLSFSTKLTDYLKSGRCIFAVGGEEIAPIDYLRKEDAGMIATTEQEILTKLQNLANTPALVNTYGQKAYECGKRNHDRHMINQLFVENMLTVQKGEKQ